ncbi:hypothetical protein [Eleftheria terrae]|uniref:hypothetical protein n=1 Tax=Eleftheria terrae TaxID=1597781 RepID=UPI00263B745B|nr:hypothetical protein [Eleftheria terrae]WKB52600.1 hypothetical protein N7L95_22895 [Eleftheria terrae]
MVKAALCLLASLGVAAAQAQQRVGSPAGLPATLSVDVQENGAWTDEISGDETPEQCAAFVLAPDDVREFFRRARGASPREFGHDLDMSRCHARGSLRLADGRPAGWFIDRERRGRLTLPDGRTLYFHCGECRTPAFEAP